MRSRILAVAGFFSVVTVVVVVVVFVLVVVIIVNDITCCFSLCYHFCPLCSRRLCVVVVDIFIFTVK